MPESGSYDPVNFCERLDEAGFPPRLRERVKRWRREFAANPYKGAFPEPGEKGEAWLVAVPHTYTDGLTVVCSFGIDEEAMVIRCNWFALRDDPPQAGH